MLRTTESGGIWRHIGKSLLAQVAYQTRALELLEWAGQSWRGGRPRVLILAYHRVVEDFVGESQRAIPSLLISRSTFARHMQLLRSSYDVVTLSEAVREMCRPDEGGAPLRGGPTRPLAAITFDDGYADVYESAFPILRQLGLPFTVFVVSGYVGTDRRLPHDRLHWALLRLLERRPWAGPRLPPALLAQLRGVGLELDAPRPTQGLWARPPFGTSAPERAGWLRSLQAATIVSRLQAVLSLGRMEEVIAELRGVLGAQDEPVAGRMLSWDQIVEMAHHGGSTGAHTVEHAVLSHEPHARVVKELCDSKADLELALDREVRCFAYPDGRYHDRVVDTVARAGFALAVTTEDRIGGPGTSPLMVPRKTLWEMSSQGLLGPSLAVLAAQLGHLYGRLGLQAPRSGASAASSEP